MSLAAQAVSSQSDRRAQDALVSSFVDQLANDDREYVLALLLQKRPQVGCGMRAHCPVRHAAPHAAAQAALVLLCSHLQRSGATLPRELARGAMQALEGSAGPPSLLAELAPTPAAAVDAAGGATAQRTKKARKRAAVRVCRLCAASAAHWLTQDSPPLQRPAASRPFAVKLRPIVNSPSGADAPLDSEASPRSQRSVTGAPSRVTAHTGDAHSAAAAVQTPPSRCPRPRGLWCTRRGARWQPASRRALRWRSQRLPSHWA